MNNTNKQNLTQEESEKMSSDTFEISQKLLATFQEEIKRLIEKGGYETRHLGTINSGVIIHTASVLIASVARMVQETKQADFIEQVLNDTKVHTHQLLSMNKTEN